MQKSDLLEKEKRELIYEHGYSQGTKNAFINFEKFREFIKIHKISEEEENKYVQSFVTGFKKARREID